ncbi:MAG TPA: type II toxin-antitoxin system prevent-host-death family antitoxin [Candidatus Limnocylindria bacterium]
MKSIGVRELRQQASRYLREVERGYAIEVTDRGRPVARLVPVPRAGQADALLQSGALSPAIGDPLELGEPLPPVPGVPLPSAELAAMRRDER